MHYIIYILKTSDGDIGVDIEPNCLNDAKHPLFVIENCKNLYTELLLHLENFESIQNFGKVIYTIFLFLNTLTLFPTQAILIKNF